MAQWEREERLARAFLELADTLVDGFYLVDFLHVLTDHMLAILDVAAIGVVMVDAQGRLVDVTASTHTAHQLEEIQIEFDEGPNKDACEQHAQVGSVDLTRPDAAAHWPHFTKAARTIGFTTVAALPLRLREEVIGAVNVFHHDPTGLHPASLRLGQALADAATIGILHQRLSQNQAERVGQLQTALNSRIIIEQAKGALGARLHITPDIAFARLRAHAHRTSLTQLCRHVVEGRVPSETFATPPDLPHPR
ncbi:GAF and ANTAR domain-containing protein [Streptomyces spectabilis]|uniref:Transcriptional regulator with GAF, ATPase, and Fis domain n=1 Tax=Streptomyces spectabilis TaxID=68270 RepID=A0A7W8B4D4_STRST|nr:GAF and ANTAR domain-containing protein [Streptomyces spectabilis]MBB5110145.1 transcriptional regulator with GAF, ATPase, and Fis domain [Streptomyces spectabilis]GGV59011.1 transcriptional regulator [Streptomyces spectabilis]